LKKAKDEMSEANALAAALVIGPIADVASASGRYYKTVKKMPRETPHEPSHNRNPYRQ
jgi:hypothetical protein